MPSRQVAAKELGDIFKVIAHPDRIRLIEELGGRECDVNTLTEILGIPGPRVSQHLALMRAHRLVDERREGRHHIYRLTQPEIARWILEGLAFIEYRMDPENQQKIADARALWLGQNEPTRDCQ